MDNQPIKTGVIYCRVSSAEQVDNTSLESQERYCREYATREGIKVVSIFVEKGESAKTADRTEFIKAINFCANKKQKIGYFIVYKLDRFARNQNDHVVTKATLKRHGVVLRSVTEPIDETPIGRVMEGVISVFAEFDNNVRTERTKNGMMEQVKKGFWPWREPIGFHRPYKGANIQPDPLYSPYIATTYEEWAKGHHTYQSLSDYLKNIGFKTRNGKPPCAQLVEKILRNPLHCGIIRIWGLEVRTDFGIVSEDLYNRCQKGYRKNGLKISRSANSPLFPLKRICLCTECNTSLTGSSPTGRKGVKYHYYHHQKQGCSKAQSIPKELLEQSFVEFLDEITPSGKYEKTFKAVVMDIWQNNYKKLDEDNAKVHLQIEKLESDRQKVFDMHRAGKYSDDEFLEQKDIINKTIYHKRQLLVDNHIEEFDMEEALDYCFRFVRETSKTWVRLKKQSYERLMRFQKQVFPQKITFDGNKFGTTDIALVYKLNQQNGANKSQIVALRGIEPRLTD